jgi:hypothetical protein
MKYNFKTVVCPKCGAPEGFQCKTANGRKVTGAYPHIDRVHAFAAKQRVSSQANNAVRELPSHPQDLEAAKRSAKNGLANALRGGFAELATNTGWR